MATVVDPYHRERLVTIYNAAADAGAWDRAALECTIGAPAQVRTV